MKLNHAKMADRRIKIELTCGGGGKGEERQSKIKERNVALAKSRKKKLKKRQLNKASATESWIIVHKHHFSSHCLPSVIWHVITQSAWIPNYLHPHMQGTLCTACIASHIRTVYSDWWLTWQQTKKALPKMSWIMYVSPRLIKLSMHWTSFIVLQYNTQIHHGRGKMSCDQHMTWHDATTVHPRIEGTSDINDDGWRSWQGGRVVSLDQCCPPQPTVHQLM